MILRTFYQAVFLIGAVFCVPLLWNVMHLLSFSSPSTSFQKQRSCFKTLLRSQTSDLNFNKNNKRSCRTSFKHLKYWGATQGWYQQSLMTYQPLFLSFNSSTIINPLAYVGSTSNTENTSVESWLSPQIVARQQNHHSVFIFRKR